MAVDLIGTQLVFVNGVLVTNYTLDDASATGNIVFDTDLTVGDFVHIINYGFGGSVDENVIAEYPTYVNNESFTVTAVAPAYPTDYQFELSRASFNQLALDSQTIVELNGKRLRPTTNVYYTGNGSTTVYDCPHTAQDIELDTVLNTDVVVYVNSVLQVEGTDYTVLPSVLGSDPNNQVTFVTAPALSDKICIGITKFAEFTFIDDITVEISSSITLEEDDKVNVITFSNNNNLGIKTNVYLGNQSSSATVVVGLDTVSFDSIEFDSDATVSISKPEFELSEEIEDLNYSWVTLNGTRLMPNFGFTISGTTLSLGENYPLQSTDVLVVTTMSSVTLSQPLSYRIFKDMVGSTDYMRISKLATTTLLANLAIDDTEIVVDDASKLAVPNASNAQPGVIFINGERITYYTIDVNTNTLGQIRRGTSGTGATDHLVGSRVDDGSTSQLIPSSDNYSFTPLSNTVVTTTDISGNVPAQTYTLQANVEYTQATCWYTLGANSATDGRSLVSSTTEQATFLKAEPGILP